MTQNFSQSAAYRDLKIKNLYAMTEEEARIAFAKIRWGSVDTMPCPRCGHVARHTPRRARKQWRCKKCSHDFSVTSGTKFSSRKLSHKQILILAAKFASRPKGLSANQTSAEFGSTLRSAYLNLGKFREGIYDDMDHSPMEGTIQVDGGHFCGKPRRPRKRKKMDSAAINTTLRNRKLSIVPPKPGARIEPWNATKLKNRRVVIVLRQLSSIKGQGASRTMAFVTKAEDLKSVYPIIRKYVKDGSILQSDEGKAYSWASQFHDHRTVNHSREYATDDGDNNNQAESCISRLRRSEYGVHHGMRPQYLAYYVAETCWRENVRRSSLNSKFEAVMRSSLTTGVSRAWRGYAQGRRLGKEYLGPLE